MPTWAVVTWDELHGLVLQGQIAPVKAALQDAQRNLFPLFTNSAPEIEGFLTRWQAERPE